VTFLELAQKLVQEADMNGDGPTTVVSQTGDYEKAVRWVNQSYMDIQLLHDDWHFMWTTFSKTLSIGTGEYTATEMSHDTPGSRFSVARFDVESFRYYPASSGLSAENFCTYWPYYDFRDQFIFGAARSSSGAPTEFTVAPNKNVLFWQTPSVSYVVNGICYRAATEMSADGDEPLLPAEFHMLIVWWALSKYAGFEESAPVFQNAMAQMSRIRNKLERQERPEICLGGPLV